MEWHRYEIFSLHQTSACHTGAYLKLIAAGGRTCACCFTAGVQRAGKHFWRPLHSGWSFDTCRSQPIFSRVMLRLLQ